MMEPASEKGRCSSGQVAVTGQWWCHGIMGRRFTDGGLVRYRKWVPQQLGDVNKQWSGDSRPMGARHGDTAANHTDLQSGCGRTCVFAVRVWSNLWELIWLRTSHYSMVLTGWNDGGSESISYIVVVWLWVGHIKEPINQEKRNDHFKNLIWEVLPLLRIS